MHGRTCSLKDNTIRHTASVSKVPDVAKGLYYEVVIPSNLQAYRHYHALNYTIICYMSKHSHLHHRTGIVDIPQDCRVHQDVVMLDVGVTSLSLWGSSFGLTGPEKPLLEAIRLRLRKTACSNRVVSLLLDPS